MEFKALMDITPKEDVEEYRLLHGDDDFPNDQRKFGVARIDIPMDMVAFFHDVPNQDHNGRALTRVFTVTHNIFDLVVDFEEFQKLKTNR